MALYPCGFCKSEFTDMEILREHMRTCIKDFDNERKKFKCEKCSYRSFRERDLQLHQVKKHGVESDREGSGEKNSKEKEVDNSPWKTQDPGSLDKLIGVTASAADPTVRKPTAPSKPFTPKRRETEAAGDHKVVKKQCIFPNLDDDLNLSEVSTDDSDDDCVVTTTPAAAKKDSNRRVVVSAATSGKKERSCTVTKATETAACSIPKVVGSMPKVVGTVSASAVPKKSLDTVKPAVADGREGSERTVTGHMGDKRENAMEHCACTFSLVGEQEVLRYTERTKEWEERGRKYRETDKFWWRERK